jgi:hypothetical protein
VHADAARVTVEHGADLAGGGAPIAIEEGGLTWVLDFEIAGVALEPVGAGGKIGDLQRSAEDGWENHGNSLDERR